MRPWSRLRAWYDENRLAVQLTALILLLLILYLIPLSVVTIGPGQAGVKWRRFHLLNEDGTEVDRVYGEGTHLKLPWDRMFLYNVRLQEHTHTYNVLSLDGLPMRVDITVRFRPLVPELGQLHKNVGPKYREVLLVPEVGAHARKQIARLTPEELFTARREEIEREIYRNLVDEMEIRFAPRQSLLTGAGRLHRRILRALAGSLVPPTAAQVAGPLALRPEQAETALRELADAGVVDRVRFSGETEEQPLRYRVDRALLADSRSLEELVGEGDPLLYIEDVLIRRILLPRPIEQAIQNKLIVKEQVKEYEYRLLREERERERKRIEAEGIRLFQDIVAEGISDRYLKWKGIDATLELARSSNAKVVVIGNAEDGLPLILGPLETTGAPEPGRPGAGAAVRPAPPVGGTPGATPIPATPPSTPLPGAPGGPGGPVR
ncbi:MAG TPA: prohibitin family protein [Thermoanaerobaculia bacterium]|nr:prohibitin family protein [Thermoanaerobaculia bacterium]